MQLWVLHDTFSTRCWIRHTKALLFYEACKPPTKDTMPRGREVNLGTDGGLIGFYMSLEQAKNACKNFVMGVTQNGT